MLWRGDELRTASWDSRAQYAQSVGVSEFAEDAVRPGKHPQRLQQTLRRSQLPPGHDGGWDGMEIQMGMCMGNRTMERASRRRLDMMHEAYSSPGGGASMARWPILLRCTPNGRTNGETKRTCRQRVRKRPHCARVLGAVRNCHLTEHTWSSVGQGGKRAGPFVATGHHRCRARNITRQRPFPPQSGLQRPTSAAHAPPSASIASRSPLSF